MVSSGDELASYDQLQDDVRATSHPIAGPSTKRKVHAVATKRPGPGGVISISSDEETHPPTAKRGKMTTGPRSVSYRGKAVGKAPTGSSSRRNKVADGSGLVNVEETAAETDDEVGVPRGATRLVTSESKSRSHERLQAQLVRLQRKLDDVVQQRDSMSNQLEEVYQLRQNDTEKLWIDQKAQYEARLKAHEDTIQELQSSLARVDVLSKSGGTTSLHFLTRETADEEKQEVQREVGRLKRAIKEKDAVITEKDLNIQKLTDTIQVLRADLKAEIENTKAVTSRNQSFSGPKHSSKPTDPKHAMVIRLYEELTGILITNVKHEPGTFKEDDAVYTCIQTTSNHKSLQFTLKFFQEPEEGEPIENAGQNDRIVDKVIYTPHSLDKEPKEFVAQLDFLAGPFTFQKVQMNVFTKTLTSYLEGDTEDDVSQMEVEND